MGKVATPDHLIPLFQKVGAKLESDANIYLLGQDERAPQEERDLYVEALPCVSYFSLY